MWPPQAAPTRSTFRRVRSRWRYGRRTTPVVCRPSLPLRRSPPSLRMHAPCPCATWSLLKREPAGASSQFNAAAPSSARRRASGKSASGAKFWDRNRFAPILEGDFERHPDSNVLGRASHYIGHHLRPLFQGHQRDHIGDLIGESGRYRAPHNSERQQLRTATGVDPFDVFTEIFRAVDPREELVLVATGTALDAQLMLSAPFPIGRGFRRRGGDLHTSSCHQTGSLPKMAVQ